MSAIDQRLKLALPVRLNKDVTLSVLLFGIFSITALLTRPLLPIDETRYLTVAWEMWRSGNYFVPTLNGDIYSHKPPLLFWLINLVWSITGVNEFSARLIGPVAGLVSILLTVQLAIALASSVNIDVPTPYVLVMVSVTVYAPLSICIRNVI